LSSDHGHNDTTYVYQEVWPPLMTPVQHFELRRGRDETYNYRRCELAYDLDH